MTLWVHCDICSEEEEVGPCNYHEPEHAICGFNVCHRHMLEIEDMVRKYVRNEQDNVSCETK